MQLYSRIVVNLLVKLPRKNPRCMGAMGGPTPTEPLAAVSRPTKSRTRSSPLGLGPTPKGGAILEPWAFMETAKAKGTKAQRPMAPCLGGGNTLARRLAQGGVVCPPYLFPTYVPPRWPPHIRGSTMSYSHIVMFLHSHIVD